MSRIVLPDSGSLIKGVVVLPPLMLLWRIGLVALISSLRSCSPWSSLIV